MQASVIRPEEAIRRVMPLPASRRAQALRSLLQGHPHELARALDMLPTAGAPPASMLEDKSPPVPQVRVGPYSLRSVLGEGGFGVVWLATQQEPLERSVALKILRPDRIDPSSRARFETERRLLALLDHPSLVKVFEAGETDDGRPWFSMELAAGAPITEAANAARLGIDDRLRLVTQVARAVHHAHERGLVHRDLKPANILLSVEGDQLQVKVIDFGVAHAAFEPTDPDQNAGALVGTPDYLAPELLRLHTSAPAVRSDVFSLGVILRRLLVDTDLGDRRESVLSALLALDRDMQRTVAQERHETVASLRRRIDGDLEAIVARCLADDPRARYASALEFAQDIDRHLRGEAVLARGDSLAYHGLVAARRSGRSVAIGALIAAVSLAGFVWALRERHAALAARDLAEDSARNMQQANALVIDLLDEIARTPSVKPRAAGDLLSEASRLAGLRLAQQPMQEARVRSALGSLFTHIGQHERAVQEYGRAQQLAGSRVGLAEFETLRLALAEALRKAGRGPEAIEMADRAVNDASMQKPEDVDDLARALVQRALALHAAGDLDAAQRAIATASRLATTTPGDARDLLDEIADARRQMGIFPAGRAASPTP